MPPCQHHEIRWINPETLSVVCDCAMNAADAPADTPIQHQLSSNSVNYRFAQHACGDS